MDYTTLKNEITTDPAKLGYAPFVASGNDAGIANLLNTAGSGTVTLPQLDKATFLLNITPAYLSLAAASATLQDKWDRILDSVRAVPSVDFTNAGVQGLLAAAVADGILTSAQVTALNQRQGPRAEVVFGAGTTVSLSDISYALRGQR